MKSISKGLIATVCLTGSITVEHATTGPFKEGAFSIANHHFDFGFSRAFADDSQDGDRMAECNDLALQNFNNCMDEANYDENILIAAWIEANCRIAWVDAQRMCSLLGLGY